MAGTLYLVGTPIGNLEDMTYRAVRTLAEADLIAAEDTRNSMKLLTRFDIHTPMTSYHEYNKFDKGEVLLERLKEGKNIALITDAGMPGISDPGEELVRACLDEGIPVTSVPGPAACVTALALSGLSTRRFAFEAFLPQEKKERESILEELKTETRTIVLYEAPHRLIKTLKLLYERLGEREVTVCRELTKKHETILRLKLSEAAAYYEEYPPKGECVIVIAGKNRREIEAEQHAQWADVDVAAHVQRYLDEGLDKKEAMKRAAKDRGVSKREIYGALLGKE